MLSFLPDPNSGNSSRARCLKAVDGISRKAKVLVAFYKEVEEKILRSDLNRETDPERLIFKTTTLLGSAHGYIPPPRGKSGKGLCGKEFSSLGHRS